ELVGDPPDDQTKLPLLIRIENELVADFHELERIARQLRVVARRFVQGIFAFVSDSRPLAEMREQAGRQLLLLVNVHEKVVLSEHLRPQRKLGFIIDQWEKMIDESIHV